MSWFVLLKSEVQVSSPDSSGFFRATLQGTWKGDAYLNGQIVDDTFRGPTGIMQGKKFARVGDLFIDEKLRRKGIGTKLFEAFKNALPSDIPYIHGDVVDETVKPFWEKQGFTTKDGRSYVLRL